MSNEQNSSKQYTNGEVTVVWKSGLCTHSGNCINGLPGVFNLKGRPWVNMEGATTQQIIDQVKKCPSGALSTFMNDGTELISSAKEIQCKALPNGPLVVDGEISVTLPDGQVEKRSKKTSFCRCGKSTNKPFCDGTHRKYPFE